MDRKQGCLLVEQLDDGNFKLGARSMLGPIALCPLLSQPRALNDAGLPRTKVFVFHAAEKRDVTLVAVGDTVELIDAAG